MRKKKRKKTRKKRNENQAAVGAGGASRNWAHALGRSFQSLIIPTDWK